MVKTNVFLLLAILLNMFLSCDSESKQTTSSILSESGSIVLKFDSPFADVAKLEVILKGSDFEDINIEYEPIDVERALRIDAIPVGKDRTIIINGYNIDGVLTISGEATNIEIFPNQLTEITLILHYINGAQTIDYGGITVNLELNETPTIKAIVYNPSPILADENVNFLVVAEDNDGNQLEYSWQSDHGTFDNSEVKNPVWKSPQYAGSVIISVIVDDGSDITLHSINVDVIESIPLITKTPSTGDLLINEFLFDPPDDLIGDVNQDGVRSSTEDEFVEIINVSGETLDISQISISDSVSTRHIVPDGTKLEKDKALVVFGGGLPVSFPFLFQTASAGTLSLGNTGDKIIINAKDGIAIDSIEYTGELGINQSVTRFPDLVGSFTDHLSASGGQSYFSAGRKINGELF